MLKQNIFTKTLIVYTVRSGVFRVGKKVYGNEVFEVCYILKAL